MKNKILLASALFMISIFGIAQSSCQAAFTYTLGSNGQVTFADTSSGVTGNTSYSWNFGDGQWSGQQNPGTITYAYNGTYYVTLSITDSLANCNSSYNASITVTNGQPCNLQASFTYTVDTSGYVHITNTTTNASAYTSYWWQFQGTHDSAGSSSNFTIHYLYNGTYVANVNASNSNGPCSSYFSDTIVVTTGLTCNLVPSFTTSTPGGTGVVDFTNTSTGIPPGSSIYWDFGYGFHSNLTSPTFTFSYNGTYTVNMYISDSTGLCSGSVSHTVTVLNAIPCALQASYTYTPGANGSVSFNGMVLGHDTSTRYTWNLGNGSVIDSTLSFTYTFPSNGTYYVTFTGYNQYSPCSNSFTDTIVITNASNCTPTVSFNMMKDTANPGVWSAVANYSNNVTNVVWYWGDGTYTSGYSPAHTYTAAGVYNICVYASTACGDSVIVCQNDSLYRSSSMISVSVINTNGVGIADHNSPDKEMILFPNPSLNGEFTISNVNAADVIHVTNVYGQEVNAETKKQNGSAIARIETAGAYFVNVNSKGKITTLKVIVSKE